MIVMWLSYSLKFRNLPIVFCDNKYNSILFYFIHYKGFKTAFLKMGSALESHQKILFWCLVHISDQLDQYFWEENQNTTIFCFFTSVNDCIIQEGLRASAHNLWMLLLSKHLYFLIIHQSFSLTYSHSVLAFSSLIFQYNLSNNGYYSRSYTNEDSIVNWFLYTYL